MILELYECMAATSARARISICIYIEKERERERETRSRKGEKGEKRKNRLYHGVRGRLVGDCVRVARMSSLSWCREGGGEHTDMLRR